MRIINVNESAGNTEPAFRLRRVARAAHLRIVERIGPASENATGRLIQFHTHSGPRPAA